MRTRWKATGNCSQCLKRVAVTQDGRAYRHNKGFTRNYCDGSWKPAINIEIKEKGE